MQDIVVMVRAGLSTQRRLADLVTPADDDGLVKSFLDEVAGLGNAESAQVVHEGRELLAQERTREKN